MMPAATAIARETAISVVINTLLSLAFFLAMFGMHGRVPLWGMGNYVFDFVPQSFAIAGMSVLVPGMLTARKLALGAVAPLAGPSPWPARLVPRALLFALMATAAGGGLAAALAFLSGATGIGWSTALTFKLGYGAALAWIVTPIGMRAVLRSRSDIMRA
jgi:hypothetical protein